MRYTHPKPRLPFTMLCHRCGAKIHLQRLRGTWTGQCRDIGGPLPQRVINIKTDRPFCFRCAEDGAEQ